MRLLLDERVLAAVRLVDAASGRPIGEGFRLTADGVVWRRQARGLFVVVSAAGLEDHMFAFEAPPEPPDEPLVVSVRVEDPAGRYVPRRFSLQLPRDPSPEAAAADSLFVPVEVAMFPSPVALLRSTWTRLRARVLDQAGDPVPRALLRVVRTADEVVLARGLAMGPGTTAGEALVVVPGVPLTTFSDDDDDDAPVVALEVAARLEAFADLAASPDLPADPDDLEARLDELATGSLELALVNGRELTLSLSLEPPP